MQDVVIISAKRTPIGAFNGAFSSVSARDLGVHAGRAVLEQAGVSPEEVQELILGNVLGAGQGMNIARQVALGIGMSHNSTAYTVGKVCGSGMKAVALGSQSIACGDCDVVLAGGAENMSQAPYVMPKARWGQRMGHGQIIDTMISDGLTDVFNDYHMGITAENLAKKFAISRHEQDEYAAQSQQRAIAAQKAKRFDDEITPIEVTLREKSIFVEKDEGPRDGTTTDTLAKLRPVFDRDGTVTAGNASSINDGAAMVLLMSRSKAQELGLKPMAIIRSCASAGVDPEVMGYGPVPSTEKALSKAGLSIGDIGLIEANEAFAVQAISVCKELGLNPDITNVNGGAIALGHPIGASGVRVLVSLIYEMKKRRVQYGLATLCIGGGMGISMVVEQEV